MTQFNLLPDIKLKYVRAQRIKRLVTVLSTLITVAAVIIFVIMLLLVNVVQKKSLSDVDKDIKTASAKLKAVPDINKILTVQNQLNSLPTMDDQKPATNRLFGYMAKITPGNVFVNNLNVDFAQDSITVTGTTDSLDTVNVYIDTLKFATFKAKDNSVTGSQQSESKKMFSNVVLSSFGRSADGASYTINMDFDPTLFDITQSIKINVPNKVTTRSVLEQPSPQALFQNAPPTSESKG